MELQDFCKPRKSSEDNYFKGLQRCKNKHPPPPPLWNISSFMESSFISAYALRAFLGKSSVRDLCHCFLSQILVKKKKNWTNLISFLLVPFKS